jgi:hypothetical protein
VELRASDEDRQRILDALQRHTAAGRLSLDEFSDRAAEVYAARTVGDLTAITGDLPAEPVAPAADGPPSERRELLVVFAVAAITLVLLGLFMALTR